MVSVNLDVNSDGKEPSLCWANWNEDVSRLSVRKRNSKSTLKIDKVGGWKTILSTFPFWKAHLGGLFAVSFRECSRLVV